MKKITGVVAASWLILSLQAQKNQPVQKDSGAVFKKEVYALAGVTHGTIRNANISSDEYARTSGALRPSLGVNYFIPVSGHLGYLVGFEYNEFRNTSTYAGYFRSAALQADKAGRYHYPLVEANYTDTRNFSCIDIPVCLRVQGQLNNGLELYLDAGFKLNVSLGYRLTKKGIYNTKGLYPLYGSNDLLLVENNPNLGFVNTTYNNSVVEIEAQKVGYSFFVSPGLKVKTSAKTCLLLSLVYLSGINDTQANSGVQYVNVFGEKSPHQKYTVFQTGFRIGIGYRMDNRPSSNK